MMSNHFLCSTIFVLISFLQSIEAFCSSVHHCKHFGEKTGGSEYNYHHTHAVIYRQISSQKTALVNSEDFALNTWQPTAYVVLSAAILGVLTQSFINTMLRGDQGLSAFLSDGNGFSNSKFKPLENNRKENDPLPWLKLPKFDYVEVAGQTDKEEEMELLIVEKLESLSAKMKEEMNAGETEKAASTMKQLNDLMNEYGFEYKEDKNNS